MIYNPESLECRQHLASALLAMLEKAGFQEQEKSAGTTEKVYFRNAENERIKVLVFTTIVNKSVRKTGRDAIRICGIYVDEKGNQKGLAKARRVNRVGTIEDITERTLKRMREIYKQTSHPEMCVICKKAPIYTSKKGNRVCAELCWLKKGFGRK